ncbi:hypothetical protein D3C73_1493340 [compost metagenome]
MNGLNYVLYLMVRHNWMQRDTDPARFMTEISRIDTIRDLSGHRLIHIKYIVAEYSRAGAAPSCLNTVTVIKKPDHQIIMDIVHMKRNDTVSLIQMAIQHMKSRNTS